MRVLLAVTCALGLLVRLHAEYPTVFFGARLNLQARVNERATALRWYDDLACHSVVFLQFYHEAGYGAYVAQRLQNLPDDRSRTALDEAYIERLEGWRIGKFYAPFGAGLLLSESVLAVQSPARFAIGDLPMRVAYLYNGADRQQGLYVRVGTTRGGVSVGVGRHFGTDPHAFALYELPEEQRSLHGYDTLYGADYTFYLGSVHAQLEWVYSEGRQASASHWLAARLHARSLPFQPELSIAYQTVAGRVSWRLAAQQRAGDRASFNLTLRGKAGTIQFVAFGVQGEL